MHVYEVRPRKDHRSVDLISDALPFGRLWYDGPDAAANAVIRVYDDVGNVIVIVAGFVGTEYRT
jgi:hypothetical protein